MKNHRGRLFVVATPLGNLKDITYRAAETLKSASLIAAEDTRRTKKLLSHLGIRVRVISCHEHNESKRVQLILDCCEQGGDVVLVSDAGTPGISDPGAKVIGELRRAGIEILPVPGPSAVACALSVCGMKADSYHFVGFLPSKKSDRIEALKELAPMKCLLVFFESPYRIVDSLKDILHTLGDREAFLGREMTKVHETYISGKISEIITSLCTNKSVKGEITLVVEGAKDLDDDEDVVPEKMEMLLLHLLQGKKMSVKDASSLLSDVCDIKKGSIYRLALDMQKRGEKQ